MRELGPRRPTADVYVIDAMAAGAAGWENRVPEGAPVIILTSSAEDLPDQGSVVSTLDTEDITELLPAAVTLAAAGYRVIVDGPVSAGHTGQSGGAGLTAREKEVLRLLADGLTNGEIADSLGISINTVKFHLASLYAAVSVTSRAEAVREGIRRGLIDL